MIAGSQLGSQAVGIGKVDADQNFVRNANQATRSGFSFQLQALNIPFKLP
jgi:hypothetical protein